jgi:hypothetical protein
LGIPPPPPPKQTQKTKNIMETFPYSQCLHPCHYKN